MPEIGGNIAEESNSVDDEEDPWLDLITEFQAMVP